MNDIKPTTDGAGQYSPIHHGRYRIVKRAFRRDETGAIYFDYDIEHLTTRGWIFVPFLFPDVFVWKPFEREVCYEMDCHKEQYRFSTEILAREFIKNMEQPLPDDEILEN